MKKRIKVLLVVFCLIYFSNLQAQQLFIKIGSQISLKKLYSYGEYDKKNYPGFVGGASARFILGKKSFYIQPELLFSTFTSKGKHEGSRYYPVTNDIIWIKGSSRYTYSNLRLPILIGKKFDLGKQNIYINLGPAMGVILNSKGQAISKGIDRETGEALINPITGEEVIFIDSQDYAASASDFELGIGLQTGLGIDFSGFSLDLNHLMGLSWLWGGTSGHGIQFTFGYQLFDKKRVKIKK